MPTTKGRCECRFGFGESMPDKRGDTHTLSPLASGSGVQQCSSCCSSAGFWGHHSKFSCSFPQALRSWISGRFTPEFAAVKDGFH